ICALALATLMAAPAQPLSLDDAVKLSMERNPDLRKQVLLALSAEQDKVLARSAVLPSLGFNASFTDTRQAGASIIQSIDVPAVAPVAVSHTWAGSLSLKQLVFDGGKWWNNLDAA